MDRGSIGRGLHPKQILLLLLLDNSNTAVVLFKSVGTVFSDMFVTLEVQSALRVRIVEPGFCQNQQVRSDLMQQVSNVVEFSAHTPAVQMKNNTFHTRELLVGRVR